MCWRHNVYNFTSTGISYPETKIPDRIHRRVSTSMTNKNRLLQFRAVLLGNWLPRDPMTFTPSSLNVLLINRRHCECFRRRRHVCVVLQDALYICRVEGGVRERKSRLLKKGITAIWWQCPCHQTLLDFSVACKYVWK